MRSPERFNFDNTRYSLGIVTYIDRYERFFKTLISQLTMLFPDTHITVCVNGYYDQVKQSKYLLQITEFTRRFTNVKLVTYNEGQSLSKLWNQLVINSPVDKVFIFNDDTKIVPDFRNNLERSNVLEYNVALLNESWSHFLISKDVISQIGWFDERFPGVGNEDWDYEARLSVHCIKIQSVNLKGLRNIVFRTRNFSYGKNIKVANKKYVGSNLEFFYNKWEVRKQHGPGFVWVRILDGYARQKHGMDTPNFYQHISPIIAVTGGPK